MTKLRLRLKLESTAARGAPTSAMITLPPEASAQLGTRARVNVKGTINGYAFKSSMFPTGEGTHYMVINRRMREVANVGVGEEADVTLEVDAEPRTAAVPPDLKEALAKFKTAQAEFERLPPSHKREYVSYIDEAKRPETRARRIEQAVRRLIEEAKEKKSRRRSPTRSGRR